MLWSSNSLIYINILHLSESAGNMLFKNTLVWQMFGEKALGKCTVLGSPFWAELFSPQKMGDHKTLKVVRRPLFSHWKSAALGRQEIWCQIYGKKILNPVKGYWSCFILWHCHPLENQRTIKIMIIKIPHVQKNVQTNQYIFIHGPLFSQLWFCWIQPKF